jgi:hypothetical protein
MGIELHTIVITNLLIHGFIIIANGWITTDIIVKNMIINIIKRLEKSYTGDQ